MSKFFEDLKSALLEVLVMHYKKKSKDPKQPKGRLVLWERKLLESLKDDEVAQGYLKACKDDETPGLYEHALKQVKLARLWRDNEDDEMIEAYLKATYGDSYDR